MAAPSQTKWHGVAALYWTKINRSKPIKTENNALPNLGTCTPYLDILPTMKMEWLTQKTRDTRPTCSISTSSNTKWLPAQLANLVVHFMGNHSITAFKQSPREKIKHASRPSSLTEIELKGMKVSWPRCSPELLWWIVDYLLMYSGFTDSFRFLLCTRLRGNYIIF